MSYNNKNRLITLYDVMNFNLDFMKMIQDSHSSSFFIQFLRDTHNVENANFILDVGAFKLNPCRLNADVIISKYILEDSEYELNINSYIRDNVIRSYVTNDMFDEVLKLILIGLNEQVFPLYLKSNSFLEFLSHSTLSTLYEIGTIRQDCILYHLDRLYNLVDPYVTIQDISFIEKQMIECNEDQWELLGKSKNHTCWYSKNIYDICNSTGLNFFKYYVDLDYDIHGCLRIFKELHLRQELDKNLVSITDIDYLIPTNQEQLYTAITREEYKLVLPFKNREFIVSTSGIYKNDMFIIVMKTSNYDVPTTKKVIRCPSIGGWIFKKNGNRTQYCQFHYIDFKGNVSKNIMKTLLKSRASQFHSKFKRIIDNNITGINDNNIGKTIVDNDRRFVP